MLPEWEAAKMRPTGSSFSSKAAFAVSIAELTMFAMQAQEETSRGIEIYLGVTALYVVSAFAVNRVMAFIEHRVRVPGTVGAAK